MGRKNTARSSKASKQHIELTLAKLAGDELFRSWMVALEQKIDTYMLLGKPLCLMLCLRKRLENDGS